MGVLTYLFSFNGRTGRLGWWLRTAIIIPSIFLLSLIPLLGAVESSHMSPATRAHLLELFSTSQFGALMTTAPPAVANALWIMIFAQIPVFWINVAGCIKRFHDRGKTGAWTLVYFIPFIGGWWIMIECGMLSGDDNPNKYDIDTSARQTKAFSRANTALNNAALEDAASSPSASPAGGWGWQKEAVMDDPAPAANIGWKDVQTSALVKPEPPAPARPLKNNAAPWPSAPNRRSTAPAFGAKAPRSSFGLKKG